MRVLALVFVASLLLIQPARAEPREDPPKVAQSVNAWDAQPAIRWLSVERWHAAEPAPVVVRVARRSKQVSVGDGSKWDRVAACESGGDWSIATGNGYEGGLQFTHSTWVGYGGREFAEHAYDASREQQIAIAERVLAGQGWGAWPVCGRR